MLVGGTAFVGCIDPEPLRWGLMLIPLAPLGAFVAVLLPQESKYRTIVQVVGSLAMLGVGMAVIYATKGPPAVEW